MEPKDTGQKLRGILEAFASGRTCEQILADDRSLTYHDIFHAIAEAPTSFWDGNPGRDKSNGLSQTAEPVRSPARQRSD